MSDFKYVLSKDQVQGNNTGFDTFFLVNNSGLTIRNFYWFRYTK